MHRRAPTIGDTSLLSFHHSIRDCISDCWKPKSEKGKKILPPEDLLFFLPFHGETIATHSLDTGESKQIQNLQNLIQSQARSTT
jgi:hypothetical protein